MSLLPFLPNPHPVINRQKITRVDAFTQLYTRLKVASHYSDKRLAMLLCTRSMAPKPPCTLHKKQVCAMVNGKLSLVQCPARGIKSQTKDSRNGLKCMCKPKPKPMPIPASKWNDFLKYKSGVGLIYARKWTWQLLPWIINFCKHFDVRDCFKLIKHSANLHQTSLQFCRQKSTWLPCL